MREIRCKIGDRLRVGEHVVIKIVGVEDELVRLRISAPETTVVRREKSWQHQKGVEEFRHSE